MPVSETAKLNTSNALKIGETHSSMANLANGADWRPHSASQYHHADFLQTYWKIPTNSGLSDHKVLPLFEHAIDPMSVLENRYHHKTNHLN